SNLHAINLSGNQLTGAIPALGDLQNIQSFDVSGNQLSGSIPSFAGAGTMKVFKVSNNTLSGSVPSLSVLTALTEIDLDGNQLSGDLPDASKTILIAGRSTLCPNALTAKDDRIWDYATAATPWYSTCTTPQNPNQFGLTGAWYNAATSGQGF